MIRFLRRRATYANVAATIALATALGGTSYAAFTLPRNSVGSRQIRSGAVGRSELRRDAVSSSRVAPNSLTGHDIAERSLGTVPRATRASKASNASRVGGLTASALQVACPVGTVLDTGGCMEQAARPAQFFQNAAAACTGGRSLPTVAQLTGFAQGRGLTGIELTSDLASATQVYTVDLASGAIGASPLSAPLPFRCLAAQSN